MAAATSGLLDSAPARAQGAAPAAGLVGYWSFDEASGTTVVDGSGNRNNGTMSGSGVTRVAGKTGSGALRFNGSSGKVTIPNSVSLNLTSSYTITAWLRPTALNSYQTVLMKGSAGACGYWLQTVGNDPATGFGLNSSCSSYREHIARTANWQTNTWQHVAAVFDDAANAVRIYANGVLAYSATETARPLATSQALVFGQSWYAGGQYERWRGDVDEVRIYNRVLSGQEIGGVVGGDGTPPVVSLSQPTSGVTLNGTVTIAANATDNTGVAGVQFFLDDAPLGAEVGSTPYQIPWDTTTAMNGAHSLSARARDMAGNTAMSNPISVMVDNAVDTEPPGAPVNVTAVAASSTQINVSWGSSSDNVGVVSYKVYRNGGHIASASSLFYADQGLAPETTYAYAISAVDAAGNESLLSNAVSATTMPRPGGTSFLLPLKLSGDGRYLTDQVGQPFFINGDAAWSMIAQANQQEVDTYLTDRQQKGYNLVLTNLIEHEFSSNAPANIFGDQPFTTPGDFNTPNDAYFAHADYVLTKADERGMIVLLAPLYLGYQCGGQGWCGEVRDSSLATMRAWGRYVGNRYRNFSNIIWLIGADVDPVAAGVADKVREVVAGIREMGAAQLMTAGNAPEQSASDVWGAESWLDLNSVYTYFAGDTYVEALQQYNRTPFKPVFFLEGQYENSNSSTQQSLRGQAYGAVLSGTTVGHVFGNCPVWNFGISAGFCTSTNWVSQLNSPGSHSLANLGKLLGGRAFWQLVPDQTHTTLTAGYSSGYFYASTARTMDGATVVAYLPTARTVTIDMTRVSGTTARAWWFNPETAQTFLIGDFSTIGTRNFTSPSSRDWVLVLDDLAMNLPAPGTQ
jgi:hypothetical protein